MVTLIYVNYGCCAIVNDSFDICSVFKIITAVMTGPFRDSNRYLVNTYGIFDAIRNRHSVKCLIPFSTGRFLSSSLGEVPKCSQLFNFEIVT